jgi:TolA-binding protein
MTVKLLLSHLFVGLLAAAVLTSTASAQKREDFVSLQRDVAQLEDRMKQLQKSQDDKMAALTALVLQALDASGKVSANISTLQSSLTNSLTEQQAKVVAPVAVLSSKVDQLSDDFRGVRENVGELGKALTRLDAKLEDISTIVRTLNQPPPTPPPAPVNPSTPQPPPGVTAESLFESARRDQSSGKDELAMNEFLDYLKYFPMTENAPRAQYSIGVLYYRAKQYDDAVKAFDAVLERWAENQSSSEAAYMKGVALMNAGRRADAAAEFKDFIANYPGSDNIGKARDHLRELGGSPGAAKPKPATKKRP